MTGFVCAYFGAPGECSECGGFNTTTGTQFCSHECAASRAERVARHERERIARRAAEDAFAEACDRLRAEGRRSDAEIDALLASMP